MEDHVEAEPHNDVPDEDKPIPENEFTNKSSYSALTDDEVPRSIHEAVKKHEQESRISLVDDSYMNMVFAHFEEVHEQAEGNVYTALLEVM